MFLVYPGMSCFLSLSCVIGSATIGSTSSHFGNQTQECMFMLMEFANSGDLVAKLRADALSIEDKALIFYEALIGLRTLHRRGLVHRDIKPNNIFLLAEDQSAGH